MTSFYRQKTINYGYFHDGKHPVVETVQGVREINKMVKSGEYFPIIKLPYSLLEGIDDTEVSIYQHIETLEVAETHGNVPAPQDDKFNLILRRMVPRYSMALGIMPMAYMVPKEKDKELKASHQVYYIPEIIRHGNALSYHYHHGGVRAKFDGNDLIFIDKPNGIQVYSH